ncbi:SPOR domain-containing protein [Hippea alviniae]|uniref:SPOR domain-containing protein n=1 Tax=Hippea alviniae TaxID=1279027 RepID=UPI0003B542A0|nr:SPOR domain-containing protein [Hippea alviniae]
MADNDKDKIKEILEGHSKKFTAVELIVGIVVVLLVGAGIGYAIFKLLAPPSVPPVEYQAPSSEVVQPNPIKETPPPQPVVPQATQNEQAQKESNLSETTQTPNTQESNEYAVQSESQQPAGPQIITPKKQSEATQKETIPTVQKKEKKQPKHTVAVAKPKPKKEIKHKITKPKSHKSYASLKKYVIWVSSNENRKFALVTVLKLRKCGHNAFSKEVNIKGKTYTRVYVGPIKGYEAAKTEAKEIKKQLKLSYMPIIKRYDKIP